MAIALSVRPSRNACSAAVSNEMAVLIGVSGSLFGATLAEAFIAAFERELGRRIYSLPCAPKFDFRVQSLVAACLRMKKVAFFQEELPRTT